MKDGAWACASSSGLSETPGSDKSHTWTEAVCHTQTFGDAEGSSCTCMSGYRLDMKTVGYWNAWVYLKEREMNLGREKVNILKTYYKRHAKYIILFNLHEPSLEQEIIVLLQYIVKWT